MFAQEHQQRRTARFRLRDWARKAALSAVENKFDARRVAYCGYSTATGVSGVGIRVSNGRAGIAGLQTCGSVWMCPVCACKITARRSEHLGSVLGWARREGHTLAMITLTVSHKRNDKLKDVWDAVSSGWASVTSGGAWNNDESEQEFAARLQTWESEGAAHEQAKRLGRRPPRAPRGWHKRNPPVIKKGDKAKYGVLGWVRAVEVTRGRSGWHVHAHVVVVLEGNDQGFERAYALGMSMRGRWEKGIGKKGFTASKEHGLRVDVSEGAEQRLADYIAKSGEPEKVVRASIEKAGHDLAREATLGQHKKAKRGGRTPFQILADLHLGDAEDWALWIEWMQFSKGRRQLTWSSQLRELAGLAEEESDEEIAAQEFGTEEDTVLVLPHESWVGLRGQPERVGQMLSLAELSTDALEAWLDEQNLSWLPANHKTPIGTLMVR